MCSFIDLCRAVQRRDAPAHPAKSHCAYKNCDPVQHAGPNIHQSGKNALFPTQNAHFIAVAGSSQFAVDGSIHHGVRPAAQMHWLHPGQTPRHDTKGFGTALNTHHSANQTCRWPLRGLAFQNDSPGMNTDRDSPRDFIATCSNGHTARFTRNIQRHCPRSRSGTCSTPRPARLTHWTLRARRHRARTSWCAPRRPRSSCNPPCPQKP